MHALLSWTWTGVGFAVLGAAFAIFGVLVLRRELAIRRVVKNFESALGAERKRRTKL